MQGFAYAGSPRELDGQAAVEVLLIATAARRSRSARAARGG